MNKIKVESEAPNISIPLKNLPLYEAQLFSYAVKIKKIEFDSDIALLENRETDWSATITPEDNVCEPFKVSYAFVMRCKPQVGGYYVVKSDMREYWIPASIFEKIYKKVK